MRGDVRGGAPTPSLPVGCGCFPARKGGGAHAGGEVGGGGDGDECDGREAKAAWGGIRIRKMTLTGGADELWGLGVSECGWGRVGMAVWGLVAGSDLERSAGEVICSSFCEYRVA